MSSKVYSDVLNIIESFKVTESEKKSLENKGTGRLSEWNVNIEIKKSQVCGEGLFATTDIQKGTILCELNYEKHNKISMGKLWSFKMDTRNNLYRFCWRIDHFELIGPNIDEYGEIIDKDNIDAMFIINHSSDPNAWFEGDENIVASRDIKKGEEIFIDYAMLEGGMGQSFESKGVNQKRKKFLQYDFERLWDEYKNHTHSYVAKMAEYIRSQSFGEFGTPFFCLHKNITSNIHPLGFGRGLFATGNIKKGELIWLERNETENVTHVNYHEALKLEETKKNWVLHYGYQIDKDTLAVPQNVDVMEEDHSYLINHCCDPNTVFYGANLMIALKDIKEGEEVTYDYATTDTLYDSLPVCFCGSENCRKKVTSDDWQISELKEKYNNFWQPYILGMFYNYNGK